MQNVHHSFAQFKKLPNWKHIKEGKEHNYDYDSLCPHNNIKIVVGGNNLQTVILWTIRWTCLL